MSTRTAARGRKRARSPAHTASDDEAASASERERNPEARKQAKPKRHKKTSQGDTGSQASVQYDDTGPVYDTCNEVRRKIRALLRKGDTTIAAFLRELGGINSNSYRQFMGMKRPMQGSGNRLYPAAYHFFERRRLAEGKPKSKLRQESEAAFPQGHSLQPDYGRYLVPAGHVPVVDRLGRVTVVPHYPRPRPLSMKQLEKLLQQQ